MTREELLELAPLDAFGLLDEVEAALFHRAFHRAPAAVQAEVIALQAELAEADHFLADEEPREILRRKVFLRLEEVIEESTDGLRPIAQIGGRAANGPAVRGPEPGTPAGDPVQLATFRSLMEEFSERNARAAARTTPFWRAAAIVLGTALVVSLYVLGQTTSHAKEFSELVITQGVENQIWSIVPSLGKFAASGDRAYAMNPKDPNCVGLASATILVDSARGQAVVAAFGLTRLGTGTFTCRAIDREGHVAEIARIEADRFLAGALGELPDSFKPVRFELVGPDGNAVFAANV